jgi:hypothetical protein
MKKMLCLCALLGMRCIASCAWAFDAAVSSTQVAPGQKVKATVSFTGNAAAIYAVDGWLVYDAKALRLDSITKGAAADTLSIATNTSQRGLAKIALYGSTPFTTVSGELLAFNFTVRAKARPGAHVLHLSKIDFSTATATYAATINTDGTVTVARGNKQRENND